MDEKGLIEGVGSLLRSEVNGWATNGNGTPQVYPNFPPLDVPKDLYPRAALDIIGNSPQDQDVEQDMIINNILFEITIYAVDEETLSVIRGNSIAAVVSSWKDYLPSEWSFDELGEISPQLEEDSSKGFTRYQKGFEVKFDNVLKV